MSSKIVRRERESRNWPPMTSVARVRGSAILLEENWSRFNSCSDTSQSKRQRNTSGVNSVSKPLSMIGSASNQPIPVAALRRQSANV